MQKSYSDIMNKLLDFIIEAQKNKIAIGHFNFSDLAGLKAIFEAAREVGVPVVLGTSEGEREFLGPENAVSLVRNLRESYSYPVFLNADHTYSIGKVKEAALLGYDAIIFDGAKLSLEENIAKTREAVEIAKKINPEIIVEGELGYIGGSSSLLEEVPKGAQIDEKDLTSVADAERFVKETRVDLFAPAVGNIHGMFANAPNPELQIVRIEEIVKAVSVPLVLHGGSGLKNEEFTAAVKAGMTIIHINTEIRLAWRKGLERMFVEKPKEVAPYKLLSGSIEEMQKVIAQRLRLFGGKGL